MRSALMTIIAITALVAPVQAQSVMGRIHDAETGDGIPNAIVELFAGEGARVDIALTDGRGRFRLSARGSTDRVLTVEAAALGYGRGTWELPEWADRSSFDLGTLELRPAPFALDPVEVAAQRSRLTPGREWVRRRQLLERGTFFPGAMLAALNPPSLVRHLADELDFWIRYDERGTPGIYNPHAECTLILINEWPMNRTYTEEGLVEVLGFRSLDDIPLDWIAAIEVYRDMRDVPPGRLQFADGGAHPCALINVWTWDSW